MIRQFSLSALLIAIAFGSVCFWGGWLSHARLHPRAQVDSDRQAPHPRGGGAGHVVVSLEIDNPHQFQPGEKVAMDCTYVAPDGELGERVGGSHIVFEVGAGSISLLVHSDLAEQVVRDLEGGKCRLIRASPE